MGKMTETVRRLEKEAAFGREVMKLARKMRLTPSARKPKKVKTKSRRKKAGKSNTRTAQPRGRMLQQTPDQTQQTAVQ